MSMMSRRGSGPGLREGMPGAGWKFWMHWTRCTVALGKGIAHLHGAEHEDRIAGLGHWA